MRFLVFLFIVICQFSCSLTDNFNEAPMFIQIDSVDLVTSDNNIDPSHKIKDVSVYVGGANIGVFEVPAKVPILGEGEVEVTFFAGIRNNGIVLTPKDYTFYERNVMTFSFEENKVVPVNLEFNYVPDVKFAFNENFENTFLFSLDLDGDDASSLVRSDETPYGSGCGKISITEETSFFQQGTAGLYKTDVFQASDVYLELDYKCDVPFIVGYIGYDGTIQRSETFIILFERDEWDKVYLDMSVELNGGQFDSYQIFIAGLGDRQVGDVWVDNIRLVYF